MTPVLQYQSSLSANALPAGDVQVKYPLPIDCPIRLAAYALDQEFEMALAGFPPAQLNVPASNAAFNFINPDGNAILTNYSQPSNSGARRGKFKATFTRVPASWDDFDTQAWTPPGWYGTPAGATTYTSRNPYSETVTVRLHYDYFIVDPQGIIAGLASPIQDSGGNNIVLAAATDSLLNGNTAAKYVTSASAIPYISRTYFCNTLENTGETPTPIFSSHTSDLSPQGGYEALNAFYLETFPNVQVYQQWCNNVLARLAVGGNPWAAPNLVWDGGKRTNTGIPQTPYLDQTHTLITQIILKDSVLKPYAGNIWSRMTTYALTI